MKCVLVQACRKRSHFPRSSLLLLSHTAPRNPSHLSTNHLAHEHSSVLLNVIKHTTPGAHIDTHVLIQKRGKTSVALPFSRRFSLQSRSFLLSLSFSHNPTLERSSITPRLNTTFHYLSLSFCRLLSLSYPKASSRLSLSEFYSLCGCVSRSLSRSLSLSLSHPSRSPPWPNCCGL